MRSIPERWVYLLARFLGYFAFSCVRIRREETMRNLRQALGNEKSEETLKVIAREAYGNIGITFIEMLTITKLKPRIHEIVDISDIEILTRNIEKGRGVILVSCHFGSWEINGAALGLAGIPLTVVAKRQSNPYVDDYVTAYRTDCGMKMIPTGIALKHIIRALKKREVAGLISDQDAGKMGVFVTFFGRPASTPSGAAQLALKYGAPIVVSMAKRTSYGRYKNIFREIEVLDSDSVESLTQRFTSVMEEIIRQNPEQYFWMHRRWKTPVPDSAFEPGEVVSQHSGAGM